jgi:hypothetical protein
VCGLTVVRRWLQCAALACGFFSAPATFAEEPGPPEPSYRAVAETRRHSPAYPHLFGGVALGRSVRFNNPYRLSTQLGDTGESLSLGASYLDLAFGVSSARYGAFEHGGILHLSVALQGIPQEVLSFSYLVQRRLLPELLVHGRAGIPVVLEPDLNAGLELGAGATWLVRAGLGLNAELVGSLFYGAATIEESVSTIPLLSLQVGVAFDYEVLP